MDVREYQYRQSSLGTGEAEVAVATPGKRTLQPDPLRLAHGAHASSAAPAQQTSAGPTSNEAQTKSASNKSGDEDKANASAIVTGFRAAQHELEKGSPDGALKHLLYVGNVAPEYKTKVDFEDVSAAADSFDRSLRAAMNKSPAKFRQLVDMNRWIRSDVGLTIANGPHVAVSGSDASHAKAAIGPALGTLAIRTRHSIKWLDELESDDQAGRLRTVERVAGDIELTSEYVQGLLEQMPEEERRSLASAANEATHAVGKVLRWVRSRPAHQQLEAKLLRGVSSFDAVLHAMGSEPLGEQDAVALTENQQARGDEEKDKFSVEMERTITTIKNLASDLKQKIGLFAEIAGLDDQTQPDFKTSLMNAIIDATLSTIVGQFAAALATPAAVDLPIAAKTIGLPSPSKAPGNAGGIATVFSIGLGSLKTAVAAKLAAPPSAKVDQRKLALYYFCDGLKAAEDARADAYADNLRGLEAGSAITASQLHDIEQQIAAQRRAFVEHEIEIVTKAWTKYLAQSRLGARTVGHDKVTNMDHYFGEEKPGGRVFGTSKAGGDGIVSITMHVENGRPILDPSATKVIGINSVLQSHLLDAANHELDRIDLPKEVHVHAGFAHATLALDEKNHIRDVRNWDEVQRYVGGATAASFWRTWGRNLKVSQP